MQPSAQEEVKCPLHHCLHQQGDLGDITTYHKRCCFCWCSAVAPALLPALPAQSWSAVPTVTPEWGYVPLSQVFSVLWLCRLGSAPTGKIPSGVGCRAPLHPLQLFLLSNSSFPPALPPLQLFLPSNSSSSPSTALSRPWKCSQGFCWLLPGSSALLSPPAPGAEDLMGALLQFNPPADEV